VLAENKGCWAGGDGEEGRYSGLASAEPIVSVSASGSGARRFTVKGSSLKGISIGPPRPKHPTVKNENKALQKTDCPRRNCRSLERTAVISNEGMKTERGRNRGKIDNENEVVSFRHQVDDTLLGMHYYWPALSDTA
jgi:hypothetical protein